LWRYADAASELWIRTAKDRGIIGSIDHSYNAHSDDYDRLLVVADPRSISRLLSQTGPKVSLLTEGWRWREMDSKISQEVSGPQRSTERARALLKSVGLAQVGEVGLSRLVLPADMPGRRWWGNGASASRGR
jgi:hypothetical protein